ncbi:MAG: hypothetical protein KAX53_08485 [Saprospiraceae bacterium]|jgi:hypothetical protein|nr:hypothetical protein [Saprospiraceae bacterium]
MIKYLILSLISYYIFVHYLSPLIETNKNTNHQQRNDKKNNNHEDEYVDYEEIE